MVEREAAAVTSYNAVGEFDVLPGHQNFISIILGKVVLHGVDGRDQRIDIEKGVMNVYKDAVTIFLEIASELPTV